MDALIRRALLLALIVGLVVFGAGEIGWLAGLDAWMYDAAMRARRPVPSSGRVVVIEIDDESIAILGRWPWSRSRHAQFLKVLRERYQPAAVAFDLLLSEREQADRDATLATELQKSGNVYLAAFFSSLPAPQQFDESPSTQMLTGQYVGEPHWRGKVFIGLQPPLPKLALAAVGVGQVNVFPERDGCVRRLPLVLDYRGTPYLSLLGALVNSQVNPKHAPIQVALGESVNFGNHYVPIDNAGETWIGFTSTSDRASGRPFERYSYQQVLYGEVPEEALKDKLVLVGFGATGMADIHPTPISAGMLGVEINAYALDDMLRGDFITVAGGNARLAVVLALCLLTAVTAIRWPIAGALGAVVVLPALGWAMSAWLLSSRGLWMGAAPPGIAALLGYVGGTVLRYRESERESLRITASVDTLALATRLIGAARQRNDLVNEVRSQVNDALGALQTNLYLLDEQHERLTLSLPAMTGREPVSYRLGEGTIGWVAQSSEVHLVDHLLPGSTIAAELAASVSFPVGSVAYAPMSSRGKTLGVIEAIRTPSQVPFERRHLPVLEAIAAEAAVALENAALYEKLEGRVEIANRRLLGAYQELKEERDRIAAIITNMADGVILTDAEQRVLLLNPAAAHMFGVAPAAVEHRAIAETLPYPALLAQLAPTFDGSADSPRIQVMQPQRATLSPRTVRLLTPAGTPAGAVTVVSDITLLEELSEMKTEFVSVVSHELRTPLTSIMGFAQTLRSDQIPVDESERMEFLSIIEQESNRLLVMINDLLDVSRMEAGRPLPVNYTALDLALLAAHVVRFQSVTTTAHTFRFEFPEQGLWVRADRDKAEQILTNLVSNAIKYSPQGGEVVAGGHAGDDQCIVFVRDQGIGIAPEQLGQLFERYQRIDRDAIKGIRGTGLGLFLVRALVEAQGGRVWVESKAGVGSTFFFSLPAHRPVAAV